MSMPGPWVRSRSWDLGWLLGTAAVVPLGVLAVRLGAPPDAMNLGVTALVGGPHLFSTFLATYADPRFRKAHGGALLAITLAVPTIVVWLGVTRFQVLLSVFIFWASLHVLQQNAYLADVYRRRSGRAEPAWSRTVDLGLLFLSMYPIASYKLVHDDFRLGDVSILIPEAIKSPATPLLVSAAAGFFALAWLAKTLREWRTGTLNVPKTLLIGTTSLIAFLVPAAAGGKRLELAFQAVNAWHSLQYLAIVWLVLRLKRERGELESRFVSSLCAPGRGAWAFYGLLVAFTAALLGGVAALVAWKPGGLATDQYYYMSVLSALLIHYALDTWLFFAAGRAQERPGEIPLSAPMAG